MNFTSCYVTVNDYSALFCWLSEFIRISLLASSQLGDRSSVRDLLSADWLVVYNHVYRMLRVTWMIGAELTLNKQEPRSAAFSSLSPTTSCHCPFIYLNLPDSKSLLPSAGIILSQLLLYSAFLHPTLRPLRLLSLSLAFSKWIVTHTSSLCMSSSVTPALLIPLSLCRDAGWQRAFTSSFSP